MDSPNNVLGVVIPIHRQSDLNVQLIGFLREAEHAGVQVALTVNNESSLIRDDLTAGLKSLGLQNLTLSTCDIANAGKARNIALRLLDTEWVCFLDADDLLNLSNCLTLISNLSKEKTDLIVGAIRIQRFDTPEKFKDIFLIDGSNPILGLGLFPAFTRMIYRYDFISDLNFPEFKIAEDQAFLIQVLLRNPRTQFCGLNLYTYFVGHELQSTNQSSKYPDLVLALLFFWQLFAHTSSSNQKIILVFMLRIYFSILKRFKLFDLSEIQTSSTIAIKIFVKYPCDFLRTLYLLRSTGGISID
jgi:glycosyltransferase involved in cell wall biosynthesis